MKRRLDLGFTIFIALLVSVCSMSYELLIVRLLASVSSDMVTSQSITIGMFLLSLGLGSFLYSKIKKSNSWILLTNVEIALAIFGSLSLPFLAILSLFVRGTRSFIVVAQGVTIVIGTLSGMELPALISLAKPNSDRAFGLVLAANYLGALIASIALPLFLIPHFGVYVAGWIVALLTGAAASFIFFRSFEFNLHWRWLTLAIAIFLPPNLSAHREAFEQFYLKSFYYISPISPVPTEINSTLKTQASLPNIERFSTPYQEIDIVKDDFRLYGGARTTSFHLFIDQRNQFGTSTERIYHDSMVHGSINMAKKIPETVLVIGGGDGLIARELLRYPEIKQIEQVELDPQMVKLANEYRSLRDVNGGSLLNARVHVETADGFTWLRQSSQKFDAILIDLPHPVSVDLSRLYSVEFYKSVRSHLNEDGFMTFDFPFYGLLAANLRSGKPTSENLHAISSVVAAVHKAGFRSYQTFGSWESFLIATPASRSLSFDYSILSEKIGDISSFNLSPIKLPELEKNAVANSIFRPVTIKPGGS